MRQHEQPTFEEIALSDLRFDPDNPRFPSSLDGHDTNGILEFMLRDAGLVDLIRSIASQGFFPGEPILVSPQLSSPLVEDAPSDDAADKPAPPVKYWVVVEGNRRLAACMLIANPDLVEKYASVLRSAIEGTDGPNVVVDGIPCLAFESRDAILKHLGYRHVTGIKEWDPLAKARFLRQRFDSSAGGDTSERLREVARSIGSRLDYVGRLLTALALFDRIKSDNYFELQGVTESTMSFSLITSALAYSDVVEYLGLGSSRDFEMSALHLDRLKLITKVMFERPGGKKPTLGESRNIRKLADILSSPLAVAMLAQGNSLEHAWRAASGDSSGFRNFVQSAIENVDLAKTEVLSRTVDPSDYELVSELRNDVTELASMLLRPTTQDS